MPVKGDHGHLKLSYIVSIVPFCSLLLLLFNKPLILGDGTESSQSRAASSTIQLTNYEYAFKLRQLADSMNSGERLWQQRAQALSQEVNNNTIIITIEFGTTSLTQLFF